MKLAGDFLFDAPIEEVWKALLDPVVLAAVMPGCEKLDLVGSQYQGDLTIKVGPIQGKFSGKVDLTDIEEPRSYTMLVEGRGAPGFVKATAAVKLEREGEATRLRYDADAQVGGKIASVGQRLIEASARAVSKQSLEGLNDNIKIRVAANAARAARTAAEATKGSPPEDSRSLPAVEIAPSRDEAAPEAAPAADVAPAEPKKDDPPPVVLKHVDQTALAMSIAREVTKSVLPRSVLIAIAIGVAVLVGWLAFRH